MNIVNLSPRYGTLDADFKEQEIIYRKNKAFARWLKSNFPPDIKGKYSFEDMGKTCIRVFIYLDKDDEQSAINLIKWVKWIKTKRFKAEKFWRKEKGYFAYKMEREYKPYYHYMILVENAANLDGCVIKEKREMQTIFVTDCEMENIIL